MNILLIGNGFDIAHGLPTRYVDFLSFCECLEEGYYQDDISGYREFIKEKELSSFSESILIKSFSERFQQDNTFILSDKRLEELHSLIADNTWYQHFCIVRREIGENWIDFEKEISDIIKSIDAYKLCAKNEIPKDNKCLKFIQHIKGTSSYLNEAWFYRKIEKDLQRLKRALEVYLIECAQGNNRDVVLQQIKELKIDHVLSFNYTTTFADRYGNGEKVSYCYIHGKVDANHTIESNNMVLGIDEYLTGGRKNSDFCFIAFKKYFQRIMNCSGSEYYEWIKAIATDREINEKRYQNMSKKNLIPNESYRFKDLYDTNDLYIFGHSLDVTDGDVLRLFLMNDDIRTHIFYYRKNIDDKSKLSDLIQNLIRIIGQDEVIKRCGTGKINFIPQEIQNM